MANIIIGEKVVNKLGLLGTIRSFDENYIYVDYNIRVARINLNAFEQGLLKYIKPDLQKEIDESINQEKLQAQQIADRQRMAKERADYDRNTIQSQISMTHFRVVIASANIRLDSAPLSLNNVRQNDKSLIESIFNECDKDTKELYSTITPRLEYQKGVSKARSKHCVGFLTKYLDTYVFRVFSRNDIYSKLSDGIANVRNSDVTEVLRILSINNKLYCFSKNLTSAGGTLVNTKSYGTWHVSKLNSSMMLNEIIQKCDCGYLNNYIAEHNVDCLQYTNLLFPAFYNSKMEVVFKNKLFTSAYRISNIENYLEEFSTKQVDFASKNNLLNALPVIKKYGNLELDIYKNIESIFRKRANGESIYSNLEWHLSRKGLNCSDLTKKLIGFLKKIPNFVAPIYLDYINYISEEPDVTIDDFFDKYYIERHNILTEQKLMRYTRQDIEDYARAVEELSWINREENDYYVIIPKSISEFKKEGEFQHNCVYTCRYYMQVIAHNSIIVFLRKEENTPFVTIEYDYETFEVLQAYGKYNRDIDTKLYQYIVDLGKRLNVERLSQL